MRDRLKGHGRAVGLVLVGVLCATVLITPTGAHISGSVGHLWSRHIGPRVVQLVYTKPQSNARFVRRRFAVVDGTPSSAPTLLAGRGVTQVEPAGGTGNIRVRFDRDVSDCAWNATARGSVAFAWTNSSAVGNNAIVVATRDAAGAPVPSDFSLTVTC